MSEDQLSCIAPRNPGCQDIIFTRFINLTCMYFLYNLKC
jgi:hypothetical protein